MSSVDSCGFGFPAARQESISLKASISLIPSVASLQRGEVLRHTEYTIRLLRKCACRCQELVRRTGWPTQRRRRLPRSTPSEWMASLKATPQSPRFLSVCILMFLRRGFVFEKLLGHGIAEEPPAFPSGVLEACALNTSNLLLSRPCESRVYASPAKLHKEICGDGGLVGVPKRRDKRSSFPLLSLFVISSYLAATCPC